MIFCRLGCVAASKKDFTELEFQGLFEFLVIRIDGVFVGIL